MQASSLVFSRTDVGGCSHLSKAGTAGCSGSLGWAFAWTRPPVSLPVEAVANSWVVVPQGHQRACAHPTAFALFCLYLGHGDPHPPRLSSSIHAEERPPCEGVTVTVMGRDRFWEVDDRWRGNPEQAQVCTPTCPRPSPYSPVPPHPPSLFSGGPESCPTLPSQPWHS